MSLLHRWFALFEDSEHLREILDFLYSDMPGLKERLPRFLAVYIIISALCLVAMIPVNRATKAQSTEKTSLAAWATPILLAIAIIMTVPFWPDLPHVFVYTLRQFGRLLRQMGTQIIHLQVLNLLWSLPSFALDIVSLLFYGIFASLPVVLALGLEIFARGPLGPLYFVGHSLACALVLAIIGVGWSLLVASLLPVAVIIALFFVL